MSETEDLWVGSLAAFPAKQKYNNKTKKTTGINTICLEASVSMHFIYFFWHFRVCCLGFTVHLCLLTLRVVAFAAQVSLKENSVLSGLGKKKEKRNKAKPFYETS